MLQYPVTYGHRSFAFNEHLLADGSFDQTKAHNTVVLDERDPQPMFRDLREPYHLAQGGSLGAVHKGLFVLPLRGRIEVPDATQQKALGDRERAMRAAFDPYLCYVDSPTTDGAYPFDFTEDTAEVGYSNGRLPLRYYMRPAAQPRIGETLADRTYKRFSLNMIAADPRAYEQTEQGLNLILAGVYTPGSTLNTGNTAAPMGLRVIMSGSGASNFTISRLGVSFVLNLAGLVNGSHIYVKMETSGPYGLGKNLVDVAAGNANVFSRKASGPGTWLDIPPGTTPFTLANTTNVSQCSVYWFSARA